MIKVREENGTEGYAFKKNTDFFEMSDGVFWTIEALMKKYEIGRSTVYNKARDNDIPMMRVLNIVCFKDSDKFNKLKNGAGNIENLKGKQITTYAQLHRTVEDNIALNKVNWERLSEFLSKTNNRLDDVNIQLSQINQKINDVFLAADDKVEEIKILRDTMQQILDHLTKGKE